MSDNSDIIEDNDIKVQTEVNRLSPVVLAFMGDAVYEILVRNYIVSVMHIPASKIHRACVAFVKAPAQAEAVRKITPLLTDEEHTVLRRGRNANTTHVPKNATPADYRYATGLEALFGYLYLCGRTERINEIFDIIAQTKDIMPDTGC
jgi:ribonuclease III family protein